MIPHPLRGLWPPPSPRVVAFPWKLHYFISLWKSTSCFNTAWKKEVRLRSIWKGILTSQLDGIMRNESWYMVVYLMRNESWYMVVYLMRNASWYMVVYLMRNESWYMVVYLLRNESWYIVVYLMRNASWYMVVYLRVYMLFHGLDNDIMWVCPVIADFNGMRGINLLIPCVP